MGDRAGAAQVPARSTILAVYGVSPRDIDCQSTRQIIEEACPVLGNDGTIYAWLQSDDLPTMVYSLASVEFKTWLQGKATLELGEMPPAKLLRQAIDEVAFKLQTENSPRPVHPRLIMTDDTVWLSLDAGMTLRIRNGQPEIVETNEVIFPTEKHLSDMPDYEAAKPVALLDALQKYLELETNNCLRVIAWLSSIFQRDAPYPALIIVGPDASERHRVASRLRCLLDNTKHPISPMPGSQQELQQVALENFVLAFDNVSKIPEPVADGLIAFSKGTTLNLGRGRYVSRSALRFCFPKRSLMHQALFPGLSPSA